MVLAVVGVFLAGLTVGGSLFAYRTSPRNSNGFKQWNDGVSFFREWNTRGDAIRVLARFTTISMRGIVVCF